MGGWGNKDLSLAAKLSRIRGSAMTNVLEHKYGELTWS